MSCYCGIGQDFESCCKPYIDGKIKPQSPETLMRSRYTAYCISDSKYLIETTHLSTRRHHKERDILQWSKENHWLKLEVTSVEENYVTFKAYYINPQGKTIMHHEKSKFKKEGDFWYYVDGKFY